MLAIACSQVNGPIAGGRGGGGVNVEELITGSLQ